MNFFIIAAVDKNFGIGYKNKLPWHLKKDLEYFSKTTIKAPKGKINAVIMGENTWKSLPPKSQPLPQRLNVVLSKNKKFQVPSNVFLFDDLDKALSILEKKPEVNKVFVIGGATLYYTAINHPKCSHIYLTEIEKEFKVDCYFPKIPDRFKKTKESKTFEEKGIKFKFCLYQRKDSGRV